MIFLEVLGIFVGNVISTYVIRSYIINKNKDDFDKIAGKYNFSNDLCEYMESNLGKKMVWYDYIPVFNTILALADLVLRKKEMQLFENEIKSFETDFGPISNLDLNELKDDFEENKMQEYFVGYYLEGRPIVIYFYYDGVDNLLIGEAGTSFNNLAVQQRADILMHLLYEIYNGSKEYISCSRINEVFTDNMVKNLLNTFEGNDLTYIVEKNEDKLVRRKQL